MSRRVRTCFAFLVLCFVASPAYAEDKGEPADLAIRELGLDPSQLRVPILTKEQTEYARAIGQEVVCLCGTCPRHTVTDCACGWAQQNKRAIEAALLAGKTKEEIIGAYQKVFGLKIRPTPPKEGIGQLSYMVPYAAIVFGLMLIFVIGMRMRKRNETAGAMSAAGNHPLDADAAGVERSILEKELDDLDR